MSTQQRKPQPVLTPADIPDSFTKAQAREAYVRTTNLDTLDPERAALILAGNAPDVEHRLGMEKRAD